MAQEPNPESVLAVRQQKLQDLRKQGVDPYPGKVRRTHTAAAVLEAFGKLQRAKTRVSIVGRIKMMRSMGAIAFATVEDGTGTIQVTFFKDHLKSKFDDTKELDLGDFIEASGPVFVTKKGEKGVDVRAFRIITKSLRPLPAKWHGLKDPEERFRRRYLDMLANPEVRDKLTARAKLVRSLRDFLDAEGFIEIDNPVLETIASGAAAEPFATHIKAHDMDVFLRISVGELWQKRSLVGGFEKIYELGRAFRNEGVDASHNPDFSMLEYYWAYADYTDNLALHRRLFKKLVKDVTGKLKFSYQGRTIDFSKAIPTITFRDAIKKASKVDIDPFIGETRIDGDGLRKMIRETTGTDYLGAPPNKILDNLFKDTFRRKQVQPVFVTHYPAAIKPLAKRSTEDPRYAEMFQLIVDGMEISNSYTELNDPQDQEERFREQAEYQKAGDREAMQYDRDFIEALEYGMPPATGTGIGIDRLAALLTDSATIREVTAYPLMKPKT